MDSILAAILDDDVSLVKKILKSDPALATRRIETATLYQESIFHWLYVGDGPLHLAAAGHRVEIAKALISAGADSNDAMNHRHSAPLHYAADGYITGPTWDEKKQVKTILCLLAAGAKIDAQDKNGAAPLHRAVRTRCAAAVNCLLNSGCNPLIKNKPGSTAFHLAVQNTGRGGSGSAAAIAAQQKIIEAFLAHGVSTKLKDGKGKSVLDWANSSKVIEMLT